MIAHSFGIATRACAAPVESCAMFDLIERRCLDGDGLLGQPIKQLAPVCGTAPIEPKDKFVQIRTQLKFGKAAMVN